MENKSTQDKKIEGLEAEVQTLKIEKVIATEKMITSDSIIRVSEETQEECVRRQIGELESESKNQRTTFQQHTQTLEEDSW